MNAVVRACLFIYFYFFVLYVEMLLRRGGLNAVRRRLLRPWKSTARHINLSEEFINDVGWTLERACSWQYFNAECLHRAIVSYHFARALGARPTLRIGVSSEPFLSHAWVEVDGQPIADAPGRNVRDRIGGILLIFPKPS